MLDQLVKTQSLRCLTSNEFYLGWFKSYIWLKFRNILPIKCWEMEFLWNNRKVTWQNSLNVIYIRKLYVWHIWDFYFIMLWAFQIQGNIQLIPLFRFTPFPIILGQNQASKLSKKFTRQKLKKNQGVCQKLSIPPIDPKIC